MVPPQAMPPANRSSQSAVTPRLRLKSERLPGGLLAFVAASATEDASVGVKIRSSRSATNVAAHSGRHMIRHAMLTFMALASVSGACASELSAAQSTAVSDAETQGQALYAAAAKTDTAAGNDEIVQKVRARISEKRRP